MTYKLDLTSLEKAFNSLKIAFSKYNKSSNDDIIRDSVIQRFEYTYGMSIKMLERFIQITSAENVDAFTFNELIRKANEKGLLLGNLENWAVYRQKRNITSHTYDEKKALEVISIMDNFIKEIDFLMTELKTREGTL